MKEKATEQLDEVALNQLTWKPSAVRTVAVEIVKKILSPPFTFKLWPDQISLANVCAADHPCVGTAWRLLTRAKVIQQTGQYRKSLAPGRSKGSIFEYELKSRARAETFLKRNDHPVPRLDQPEFWKPPNLYP